MTTRKLRIESAERRLDALIRQNGQHNEASFDFRGIHAFLEQRQKSDAVIHRAVRAIPAQLYVILDDQSLTALYGSLHFESLIRVKFTLSTMFPGFAIEVRHHDELGPSAPQGHTPRRQVDILVHPDQMERLEFRSTTISDDEELSGYPEFSTLSEEQLACPFIVGRYAKSAESQPVRRFSAQFPLTTTQSAVTDLFRESWKSMMFVILLMPKDPNVKGASFDQVFKAFEQVLSFRNYRRTRVQAPTTGPSMWHLTRNAGFLNHGIHHFLHDDSDLVPVWPWLRGDGTTSVSSVFADSFGFPQGVLSSIAVLQDLFSIALLWQRAIQIRAHDLRFRPNIIYNAHFIRIDDQHCRISIALEFEDEFVAILPHQGAVVLIWIEHLIQFQEKTNREARLCGVVEPACESPYNLSILCDIPKGLQAETTSYASVQSIRVTMLPAVTDPDMEARFSATVEVTPSLTTPPYRDKDLLCLEDYRTYVNLSALFFDSGPRALCEPLSPSLAQLQEVRVQRLVAEDNENERATSFNVSVYRGPVDATYERDFQAWYAQMIAGCSLEQAAFLDRAQSGVRHGIALLDGLPGSGKTQTLANFVCICIQRGMKVLCTAQSNPAAQKMLEDVIHTCKQFLPLNDANQCRQFAFMDADETERRQLDTLLDMPDDDGMIPLYSFARTIVLTMEKNPQNRAVRDFLRGRAEAASGQPQSEHRLNVLDDAWKTIRNLAIQDLIVIASTTFGSGRVPVHDDTRPRASRSVSIWRPDVIILDEASQASDIDMLVLTKAIPRTAMLVVIAGDPQQLPPVVVDAHKNPLGSVLCSSVLQRLIHCHPYIERYQLTFNYRAHPALLAMPSEVFYKGRLEAAHPTTFFDESDNGRRRIRMEELLHKRFGVRRNLRRVFFDDASLPIRSISAAAASSWLNPGGIEVCVGLAYWMTSGGNVAQEDIAVITMYRADRVALRRRMDGLGLRKIRVATVDSFQGQQVDVLIVHFVAAFNKPKFAGFVDNSNRLCVATTRARQWEFMVGNMSFWEPIVRANHQRYKKSKLVDIINFLRQNDLVARLPAIAHAPSE